MHPLDHGDWRRAIEASQQVVPKKKPIRGIDWSEIFRTRPELNPPGYDETVKLMQMKRRLGAQD